MNHNLNDDLCPLCQTKITIQSIYYITDHLVAASVSLSGMQGDLYIAKVFQDTGARNWVAEGDGLAQSVSGS